MNQRYDLLAFSLLVFASVLSIWLGVWGPPNTTTWKDWQPLMASIIALGGGSFVYRGATLAYRAAVAKVEFDRFVHKRAEQRRDLGLVLRLHFAVNVLRHEAAVLRDSIPEKDYSSKAKTVKSKWFDIKEADALRESWNELASFPPWIAELLSNIKSQMYDLSTAKEICGDDAEWVVPDFSPVPPELKRVRETAKSLATLSAAACTELLKLSKALQV